MDIVVGSVVKSKAGKDKGVFYAVVACDDKAARVCDGRSRKLSNPKLKNLRHLAATATVVSLPQTDKQLRNMLRPFSKVTKED